jgi:hypothetical protein
MSIFSSGRAACFTPINREQASFDKPPAVAYYDRTNGDLKIAHADGIGSLLDDVNWNVLRVDSEGDVGRLPSALFTQDTLHAAYVDDSRGVMKHGWQLWRSEEDFTRWQAENVDTVGSTQIIPQLISRKGGALQLVYSAKAGEVRIATRTRGKWEIQSFSEEKPDTPSALNFVDNLDTLWIGYVRNGRLRLGRQIHPQADWVFENVPHQHVAVFANWARDITGVMHAVYRTRVGFHDELYHVFQKGDAWTEQISITIYNTLGQQVRVFDFVPNRFETLKITWDGRDANGQAVASGIYVVELRTARQNSSQKILLLR